MERYMRNLERKLAAEAAENNKASCTCDLTNFAVREAHMSDHPTLEQCAKMGATHRAYGWASSPWGHWSTERKAAYMAGFNGLRSADLFRSE